MSWLPILALAALAFVGALAFLRLPRGTWALFGAALLFGLTGYALQGSPGQPAAPRAPVASAANASGEAMVAARRAFYDTGMPQAPYMTTADAYARRGQYGDAAQFLRSGLRADPGNAEGWLALGNALIEHAEGRLTPAALTAYERAELLEPGQPAPSYFLGVALLRSGSPVEARAVWADLLAEAPPEAAWRADLEFRLARLDELIARMGGPPAP